MAPVLNWDDLRVALAIGGPALSRGRQASLRVNQSTATRRLAALEAAVGVTLFVRTQAGLTPTDAGATVIARAGEVELRLERMNEQLQSLDGHPAGTVPHPRRRLGARPPDANGGGALPGRLPRDRAAHGPARDRGGPAARARAVSLWFERPPREMEFAVKLGAVPFAAYAAAGSEAATGWVHLLDEEAPRLAPTRHLERLRKRGEPIHLSASDAQITFPLSPPGLAAASCPCVWPRAIRS